MTPDELSQAIDTDLHTARIHAISNHKVEWEDEGESRECRCNRIANMIANIIQKQMEEDGIRERR